MSTAIEYHPIELNERRRPVVAGTRFKVIFIAIDHLAGKTTEEICAEHPGLTLAQVHAALGYYYGHKAEFDAQIEQEREEFEELWKAEQDSPFRQKLREMGKIP